MICPSCSYSFEAANQHATCPQCKKRVGTVAERDEVEELAQVTQWFTDWDDGTWEAREEMARDEQYYHSKQWTAEQRAKLKKRGQPCLTFNHIAKKIDYIVGAEIRNRTLPKAQPNAPSGKQDGGAAAISDSLRHVSMVGRVPSVFTKGYKSLAMVGLCGHTTEVEVIKRRDDSDVAIKVKAFPWDRLWWDLTNRELDYSDATYKGTVEWMDYADAVAYYRKRPHAVDNVEEILSGAKSMNGRASGNESHADRPRWYDPKRNRVQILVAFYERDGVWMTCHFVNGGFLERPRPTGYLDEDGNDVCPLSMAAAFLDEDGLPYGLIRRMISPQDEINNRRSKALHQSNTRQVFIERGTVADADLVEFKKQVAKPDGVPVVNKGTLATGLKVERNDADFQGSLALLGEAKEEIHGIGPATPTAADAATSGRDRQLQQQLGSLELEQLNETMRELKRETYRQIYLRVRQFWTYEKWLRVADDAAPDGFRFVGLNQDTTKGKRVREMLEENIPLPQALESVGIKLEEVQQWVQQAAPMLQGIPPEQQQAAMMRHIETMPQMQERFRVNDVARLGVDIDIEESADTSSIQHELMRDLMEIGQVIVANGGQYPLDLWVEASELRPSVKAKLMARLAPKNPDPQQLEAKKQAEAMQQRIVQLEAELKQAQVTKTNADAQLSMARAADLGQPDPAQAPQIPEPPSPVDQARAHREMVGAELDVARAHSHMERDKAQTQKIHVDTMAAAKKMMEPKPEPTAAVRR
jgi:hypothetical protein